MLRLGLNKEEVMIELKDIEKVYRTDTIETLALTNINMHIAKGEFVP